MVCVAVSGAQTSATAPGLFSRETHATARIDSAEYRMKLVDVSAASTAFIRARPDAIANAGRALGSPKPEQEPPGLCAKQH